MQIQAWKICISGLNMLFYHSLNSLVFGTVSRNFTQVRGVILHNKSTRIKVKVVESFFYLICWRATRTGTKPLFCSSVSTRFCRTTWPTWSRPSQSTTSATPSGFTPTGRFWWFWATPHRTDPKTRRRSTATPSPTPRSTCKRRSQLPVWSWRGFVKGSGGEPDQNRGGKVDRSPGSRCPEIGPGGHLRSVPSAQIIDADEASFLLVN